MKAMADWATLILIIVGGTVFLAWEQPSGTADHELGLSKTSVFEVPAPPRELANASDPGDRPARPTDFPQQPPVVPHATKTSLPITIAENACLDCHAIEEKLEGEPTPIPPSHYVDLRHAPLEKQEEVVGARYNCVTCHVVPGDSTPLVGNTFQSRR